MDRTPNLDLPYIAAAQAQKHVTHNEAIRTFDAVLQISVIDKDLTAPPVSPADGERYIVAASATGAWAGMDGRIAAWQDGAWAFYAAKEGWMAWVADEDKLYAYDGSAWGDASAGAHQNVPLMGINATADTANRLSVSAAATLFNHEGTDHQLKINKSASGSSAALLYQTGFSGRAEIGTTGDDDFHFKVSADGSIWHDALVLIGGSGVARLKSFTVAGLPAASVAGAGGIGFISDETGGAVLAFSDGTNWRRLTDRAIVS